MTVNNLKRKIGVTVFLLIQCAFNEIWLYREAVTLSRVRVNEETGSMTEIGVGGNQFWLKLARVRVYLQDIKQLLNGCCNWLSG